MEFIFMKAKHTYTYCTYLEYAQLPISKERGNTHFFNKRKKIYDIKNLFIPHNARKQ